MVTHMRTVKAKIHRTRLMYGGIWRNLVAGLVARLFHRIAWLLSPRHIPKQPIGNRSRNGHCLSLGRRMSSVSCKIKFRKRTRNISKD